VKITLEGFSGEIPKLNPRYLPQTNAAQASSVRFSRGILEPMRNNVTVKTFTGTVESFSLTDDANPWRAYFFDSDVVVGPVAQDRIYATQSGDTPKLFVGSNTYELALPNPTARPGLTRTGTLDPATTETILYAFTWVTSLGEESKPSPVATGKWSPGCIMNLTLTGIVPAGRLITSKRIYRSVTTLTGVTELFFVAEIAAAATAYSHNMDVDPPVEAISSTDFDTPVASLQGLVAMPNGMMAAFSGRDIYFCEPYKPHAWPDKYSLHVNEKIVGLAAFGSSLAVLTKGQPTIIQGIHPSAMAMEKIEVMLPCVAKRSIVDMGYAAIYASTDGLVQISPSGAQLISSALWTKEQFSRDIAPASIRAGFMANRYVMSYQPGGVGSRKLLVVELAEGAAFVSPADEDQIIDFFYHVETGRLLGLKSDGLNVMSLDDPSGTFKSYTWKSKPFRLSAPTSFGVALIDAVPPDSGVPVFSCKIYGDGVLISTISTTNKIDRIADTPAEVWEIEISGNYTVTRVVIAGTPTEVFM
jgi:hypothetical protein